MRLGNYIFMTIFAILNYMSHSWYTEYRCPNDEKLLFKGALIDSEIEVKCPRCKEIVRIEGETKDRFICKKGECPSRV